MPQERILVMDDEPALRSIIAAMLRRLNYSTTATSDADEALSTFARTQLAIAFSQTS